MCMFLYVRTSGVIRAFAVMSPVAYSFDVILHPFWIEGLGLGI